MLGTVGGLSFPAQSIILKGLEKIDVLLKEETYLISIQALDCEKLLKFLIIATKTHANHLYLSEEMDHFLRECPRVSRVPRIFICYGVYM